jgi:hypothetical protein
MGDCIEFTRLKFAFIVAPATGTVSSGVYILAVNSFKYGNVTLNICSFVRQCNTFTSYMCYNDGQKNKYSVLNECNRMLKYNIW